MVRTRCSWPTNPNTVRPQYDGAGGATAWGGMGQSHPARSTQALGMSGLYRSADAIRTRFDSGDRDVHHQQPLGQRRLRSTCAANNDIRTYPRLTLTSEGWDRWLGVCGSTPFMSLTATLALIRSGIGPGDVA
jgi:hypothetical protein